MNELTHEEKIDFGQCFEIVCRKYPLINENMIIEESVNLFFVKQKAKEKLINTKPAQSD